MNTPTTFGDRPALAVSAILGATVAWAWVPAIVHWTLAENNSFAYSAIKDVVQSGSLMAYLLLTMKANYRRPNGTASLRETLLSDRAMFLCVRPASTGATIARPARSCRDVIRMPLTVIIVGSFHTAVFAAATQFVETAIAATVYEMWPLFLIVGLSRANLTDRKLRRDDTRNLGILRAEPLALSAVATLGILFMLLSQGGTTGAAISVSTLFGILLALTAAVLSVLPIVGSFALGRLLYYQLYDVRDQATEIDPSSALTPNRQRIEERGRQEMNCLVWLTLLAATLAIALSVPAQLIVAIVISSGTWALAPSGLLGAGLLGLVSTTYVILSRIGNVAASERSEVNALSYLSPVIALIILGFAGIHLRRIDLFLIGAVLVLAINMLIQLKPDQERDVSQFGKEARSGVRLGFTVLIIMLWVSGTVLYLRDELVPPEWLTWPSGQFWAVIGLSATVFTLILGFRIARLTDRMKTEDELALSLFRDSQYLVQKGVLESNFVALLADFDTTSRHDLLDSYNAITDSVKDAWDADEDASNEDALYALQKQIDMLAHSKQQGRDVVELMALTSFACVTIGIGLLARQTALVPSGADAWNGFIGEVFVLLFVSTIAFLLMNLFDLRRERETALIASVKMKRDGELTGEERITLFFRNKRQQMAPLVGAILISISMAAVFIALLYDKWHP